jgi:hypothetical protein
MTKTKKLIEKYTREAKNLNHNILFEIDKNKNIAWNGETDYKMVEYMKGQLSIIREVVHYLRNEDNFLDNQSIDYKLGSPIK